MKKTTIRTLALALAAALCVSMTACRGGGGDDDDTTDDTTTVDRLLETPIGDIEIEQTRTYQSLKLLEGDTFSFTFNPGFNMQLVRQGDNMKVVTLTFPQIIVDGKFFPVTGLNFTEGVALYTPATDADVQETLGMLEGFDTVVSDAFEGAVLRKIGVEIMELKPWYGELYYEEFEDADGNPLKLYFNAEKEMYTAYLMWENQMRYVVNHISPIVPDNAFNIPHGLEAKPK
jgi:hypothetical protein